MKRHPPTAAHITHADLSEIRTLIEQRSAVHLDESRERFLSTRVHEYAEEEKLHSGAEVLRRIRGGGSEYDAFLERLLTQETSFFRYPAVYQALGKTILPEIQERKFWRNPRTLRVWSAGCSTGEEPYSIAITLCDTLKFAEAWEIEILATDISRRALRHAEKGVYSRRSLQELTDQQVETHFGAVKTGFHVKPRIRRLISFAQMNLAAPMYVGKLDCIFCMNVLMYFTEERRLAILRGFYEALEPGGYFMLGHSETLTHTPVKFEAVTFGECRLYRKPVAAESSRSVALVENSL
ncbi:MAG TPA: protein-glutamate O-methyltransferase CheR [Candidatus Acidoferrum sp.]|jgi:chemotaxis protein methyltransferase CheR|nr:protein-glutamate O-methyltransferase CheR [Candidatus Acidoferrum sp.]